MKVSGVNNIAFKSTQISTPDSFMPVNKNEKQVKELSSVTPDYGVKVPINYKQTAVNELDNGLKVYSYKMSNGYKVTIVPMKGSPAVVKSYVNVGSMNETHNIKGISHFLEHMAFNGTNGENGHIELKQGDSFKKIDKLGGWANASTNYAITDYVNSTPLLEDKDLETQIKVIAAMAEDLKLSDNMITKEKGPVSSEINMILDNAQTIAMDQTVRSLFNIKNPADELVGGSVAHIQNLTRDDVVNYYNTYYTPDNTNIVITGDVEPEEAMKLVSKNFTSKKVSKGNKFEEELNPIEKSVRKDFISDKTNSAEVVIGFAGPKNNDTKGKILYELATTYLNSYDSGLLSNLKKQNSFPMISSERISTNPNNSRLAFLTFECSDYNCEKALQATFNALGQKQNITDEVLNRLKQKLKQENEDFLEHSLSVNDCIGYSVLDNDMEYFTQYNSILNKITKDDLKNALKEYFNVNKAAITVVHPADNTKQNVTFKGNQKSPIDTNDLSRYKLNNNYDVAFYNTNSNNINALINLYTIEPYPKKPGVVEVLSEIYANGMKNVSADQFDEFKNKNNLNISTTIGHNGLGIYMSGDTQNYKLGMQTMQALLYNPNITEKSIKTAVAKIKDNISRIEHNSEYMQNQFDRMITPYLSTTKEVLENLDNITVDDVKEFHQYLLKNSRGTVSANVPKALEKDVKNNILTAVDKMPKVKPNKFELLKVYDEKIIPIVLQIPNYNSQADISEVFTFKYNGTIKEKAIAPVMNSILSGSSIGLFDILREKENLAYSVHSYMSTKGDQGKVTLNILTTTDNKEIGEVSYDNVQKSINGFNRQIKELLDGKFTEEDLEIAKRSTKAALLNNEGNYSKIDTLEAGLNSRDGLDVKNKIYKEIDNITKDDIIEYAKKVFEFCPVYSIAASQDTLDANKEFLDKLNNQKIQINNDYINNYNPNNL